ncbi:hypothetical protein K461DRAFT_249523 [Myriangium duriaei CBS 260.36]|uniref:ZW10 C-terminal helical domain-containing protein n=1 Tax=Myriangium duriaei CBS 260.36 TaxID=1168546 RepID=A0A9P4J8A6_9PEZI|nr:hypothetical protein K461DRAFT_249523 [Myriangium duriaei CBS 260.36]
MSKAAGEQVVDRDGSTSERQSSPELKSTHVSPTLLHELEKDLDEANRQLEEHAKNVAVDGSSDVESWVSRVNRVQADLEQSKVTARTIVQQAEAHAALGTCVTDASQKIELLEKELVFNTSLEAALQELQFVYKRLGKAKELVVNEQTVSATDVLKDVRRHLDNLQPSYPSNTIHALQSRASVISGDIVDSAQRHVLGCFKITTEPPTINTSLTSTKQGESDLPNSIETLQQLGALDKPIAAIRRSLDTEFFQPWCRSSPQNPVYRIKQSDGKLWVDLDSNRASVIDILNDIGILVKFISAHLPQLVCQRLSKSLMPQFIEHFETTQLNPNVPVETEQLKRFDELLVAVRGLSQNLAEQSWEGHTQLDAWVQNAPKVWLARQREHALDTIRHSLLDHLGERKEAETRKFQSSGQEEESGTAKKPTTEEPWDTEWNDESRAGDSKAHEKNEDDDSSAWETGDEQTNDFGRSNALDATEMNDQDAAWGWEDDKRSTETDNATRQGSSIGRPSNQGNAQEEYLLEKYTVTGVPEALLRLSIAIYNQATTMVDNGAAESAVGAAIPALSNLPALAMALYRAMAVTAYDKIENGKLLLYNDALWLVDHIGALANGSHKEGRNLNLKTPVIKKLEQEAAAFERFAEMAHGAELESQRTVLRDLLDGAQGFSNCTTSPFSDECDDAVSMTVDRLRIVHGQWQPVLSRSALLESMGSLLSTVVSKYIMDIEDLADIGEDESKRLLSYCKSFSSINNLFLEQQPGSSELRDVTPVYCRNWLKLQYLGEILDGSLADIKYLWKEGELSMEFDADEVSDLIRALFADSDHRRKAIADIVRR